MAFQLLPEDLKQMIYKEYFDIVIQPDIRVPRDTVIRFMNVVMPEVPDGKLDYLELNDINDWSALLRYMKHNSPDIFQSNDELFRIINNFIEYYYSLDYYKREELKEAILGKDKKYIYKNEPIIMNAMTYFAKTKPYNTMIDPTDSMSGFTAGYCICNILPAIFGDAGLKRQVWLKLIYNLRVKME